MKIQRSLCVLALALMLASSGLAAESLSSKAGGSCAEFEAFRTSSLFAEDGLRCGTPSREVREMLYGVTAGGDASDCSQFATDPTSDFDPGDTYTINVVVHVIMNDACSTGDVSDSLIQSQIDILNEDFLALAGTNGANGTDTAIQFQLATVDPDGDPTTGITRSCNTTWFNDGGGYWNSLAWDPNRYMNIYTNTASGALGYVPFLPADNGGANVGQPFDRVVVLWNAFGRDAPRGPPYDQGRTATHEVGHYLGLEHTFSGGCATATPPGCYTSGDLICDTNSEQSPRFGCPGGAVSCGTTDPTDNYMDYTDDLCMEQFTLEQSRRERCSLEFYRSGLLNSLPPDIFEDGFESGDTSAWSSVLP